LVIALHELEIIVLQALLGVANHDGKAAKHHDACQDDRHPDLFYFLLAVLYALHKPLRKTNYLKIL
jgi:hypothetical protein